MAISQPAALQYGKACWNLITSVFIFSQFSTVKRKQNTHQLKDDIIQPNEINNLSEKQEEFESQEIEETEAEVGKQEEIVENVIG